MKKDDGGRYRPMTRIMLTAALGIALAMCALPTSALAHPGHPHFDGRLPGQPGLPAAVVSALDSSSPVPSATSRVAAPERSEFDPGPEEAPRIPNHYIVVLEDFVDHPASVAEDQTESHGGELGFVYRYALKGYSAELSRNAVDALREDPRVRYVAPDRMLEAQAQAIPTGIKRIGANQNAIADIDGKDDARVNVDVAVIDTGVDYTHPDLNVHRRVNCVPLGENSKTEGELKNCIEESGTDGTGHGTHVAGTIGGIDNSEGVVGVAPGARLWAVRVINNGGGAAQAWVVAGVDWVTAHSSEIEVANMSLGAWDVPQPALEASINASVETGVVYAVSAGNDSNNASFASPAKNPNVITVSALADYDGLLGSQASPLIDGGEEICQKPDQLYNFGEDDTLAWFSNHGNTVELAAPGVCVLSTWPGGKYAYSSGTSMASPHVAGAAALLASQSNPNSKKDVEAIRQQLIDAGNQSWVDIYSYWNSQLDSPSLKHTEEAVDSTQEPLLDVAPASAVTYTSKASEIQMTEAKLNGGANPFGANVGYQIEYGTTTAYGTKLPSSPKGVGSGNKDLKLTEAAKGLRPDTVYHYRVKTIDEASKKETYGEDRAFKTLSSAITEPATSMTKHGARLSAAIDPIGLETAYRFEYGTTTDYGQSAPTSPKAIGSGNGFVEISEPVEGLRSDTTYHFRVVAVNGEGASYGQDETFRTATGDFVASLPEGGGVPPEHYPAILTGKAVGNTVFRAWDGGSSFPLFRCDSPFALTAKLFGNAESMSASPEEAECETSYLWGTTSLKSNGCELQFYPGNGTLSEPALIVPLYGYDGTMDIGGSECTGITVSFLPSCLITLPPQRGIDVSYWSVFDSPSINVTPSKHDTKYILSGSGCPGEGTFSDGMFQNTWRFQAKGYFDEQSREAHIVEDMATTGSVSAVEASSASLHGTVETHGRESEIRIQYGETAINENVTAPINLSGSYESDAVSAPVMGLSPNTTYRYRLYVVNELGYFRGEEETFTTLQAVRVSGPTSITGTGATLNGVVNPLGVGTTYQFEYGPTKAYGTSMPVPAKSIGSGSKDVAVSEAIGGLSPLTTYHYRLKTEDGKGVVTYSEDEVLETRAFHAENAPATITGKQTALAKDSYARLNLAGGQLLCTQHGFSAELKSTGEQTLATTPSLNSCTYHGQGASVEMRGCKLILHPSGAVDVGGASCAAEPMRVSIPSCTVTIAPQANLLKASYGSYWGSFSSASRQLAMTFDLSGIQHTAAGAGCPSVGTFSNGTFSALLASVSASSAIWVDD